MAIDTHEAIQRLSMLNRDGKDHEEKAVAIMRESELTLTDLLDGFADHSANFYRAIDVLSVWDTVLAEERERKRLDAR